MFSIMMTVESTTMPKSTAPSEMRFAGVPVATRPQNAMSSASGMLSAVMSAAARVPRKSRSTMDTSTMPTSEVLQHRVRRELHEVAAVVVRHDVHPGRQDVIVADVVDASWIPSSVGRSRRRSA